MRPSPATLALLVLSILSARQPCHASFRDNHIINRKSQGKYRKDKPTAPAPPAPPAPPAQPRSKGADIAQWVRQQRPCARPAADAPPNILFLQADDFAKATISAYGGHLAPLVRAPFAASASRPRT